MRIMTIALAGALALASSAPALAAKHGGKMTGVRAAGRPLHFRLR